MDIATATANFNDTLFELLEFTIRVCPATIRTKLTIFKTLLQGYIKFDDFKLISLLSREIVQFQKEIMARDEEFFLKLAEEIQNGAHSIELKEFETKRDELLDLLRVIGKYAKTAPQAHKDVCFDKAAKLLKYASGYRIALLTRR